MTPIPITSRQNPKFKDLRLIINDRSRGECVVEGEKLIHEALRADVTPIAIWTTGPLVHGLSCPQYLINSRLFRQISPTHSGRPPLAVVAKPNVQVEGHPSPGFHVMLDHIQNPGNAGALIRAAAAFGADSVLWFGDCVDPFHHACIRGSAGSVFHMQHRVIGRTQLKRIGIPMIGTDATLGMDLGDFDWPPSAVLVFGHEGRGLDSEVCDRMTARIRIDTSNRVESLNVNGAAHIIMQHRYRHFRANRP